MRVGAVVLIVYAALIYASVARHCGVCRNAGVTLFGLVFTPVFYVLVRKAALLLAARRSPVGVHVPVEGPP